MTEWLGIEHLFELSPAEAVLGLFTPLIIFVTFFVVQLILPGIRVPGYVTNPETGKPRNYRLNGLLVFAIAAIVWAFELTGMPRDWFYRSSVYAVAGGTVAVAIATLIAVFTQPRDETRNPLAAFWLGRVQELSFLKERIDLKMYFYVVGGSMFSLNALSAAAWHVDRFGDNANPGIFLVAGFYTFYVVDYFIFERVQLYTFDVIYEKLGFKMFWGGLVVYGWIYILPIWGMAAQPSPGFTTVWTYVWLIAVAMLYAAGWVVSRGANMQKYTFKRWPDRRFLGLIQPEYIQAGERKILVSGFWGKARHMNYLGEWFHSSAIALAFGHFTNLWAWTYFIWIVTLFVIRQREDDHYCAEKYGPEKWAEYQARVKYRICPWIY